MHLFGEAYKKQLVPCQEATDLIKVQGYVGKPTYAKKTRGEQFFFVNKRFIKSAYLHHAVKHAFEGLLPSDAFPFYVLFIDIAPARIDVNVHPTKTEIKFEDERMVYSILEATIRQALAMHHIAPSLDFEQDVNFAPLRFQESTKASKPSSTAEKNYAQFRSLSTSKADRQDWEKLFERLEKGAPISKAGIEQTPVLTLPSTDYSATEKTLTEPITSSEEKTAFKMQLHARYILAPIKSGLLLIDQHAAHERILYEKYLQALENKSGTAQQLLFPHHITINPADFALVKECEEAFRSLGFVIEAFGKDSIIVSGCPAEAANHEPKQLIEGLIEQYKWNKDQLSLPPQENLARSLAKRSCIQPGKKLSSLEIDALVDQLFACKHVNHTPDGRKTWVIVTLEELGSLLKA